MVKRSMGPAIRCEALVGSGAGIPPRCGCRITREHGSWFCVTTTSMVIFCNNHGDVLRRGGHVETAQGRYHFEDGVLLMGAVSQ